ncbi:MAG TPA: tripartite tricarboxylate transporter substrate-binding protein, partial [Burkholderiales bacterium]|nr:tripartite tricarboxylate transporter substrate-binding protein [Burkholderiales bacterium]
MKAARIALASLAFAIPACASAQQPGASSYPARSIRFVIPFTPGGTADILARVMAPKMSEGLGQQVVVDNRGGSGGVIGSEIGAKSPPDGYTMMMGLTANIAINPSLYQKLPYDPLKDFAPVSMVASAPYALLVPTSLPARNVKELVALAKAKPGELAYASFGN